MKVYIRAAIQNISDMSEEDQIDLALDNNTPADVLTELANTANEDNILDTEELVKRIASNPNTPPEILERFATQSPFIHIEPLVRRVASNPSTPPELLSSLIDYSANVRAIVAENPSTPITILKMLSNPEEHIDVRYGIVCNKNLPRELVDILVNDPDSDIRGELADREDLPKDVIENMLYKLVDDPDHLVRYSVARNLYCPTELLHILSDDEDYFVRGAASQNPNMSTEDLIKLSNDSFIAKTVLRELGKRGISI